MTMDSDSRDDGFDGVRMLNSDMSYVKCLRDGHPCKMPNPNSAICRQCERIITDEISFKKRSDTPVESVVERQVYPDPYEDKGGMARKKKVLHRRVRLRRDPRQESLEIGSGCLL